MTQWWPSLLGWPAIMISLGLGVLGIVHRKAVFFVFAVVLMLPVTLYLAGTPRFGPFGLVSPALMIGSGLAVRLGKSRLAWFLLVPVFLVFLWLAAVVVSPNR